MSDLLSVLPTFPLTGFSHAILSSLEKNSISTSDLLTLDSLDVSRRTGISLLDVRRFTNEVVQALYRDLNLSRENAQTRNQSAVRHVCETSEDSFDAWRNQQFLTTGDGTIDQLLGGGLMVGCISEFVGESGVGKTQILLQLCVTAQLPQSVGGLGRSAVYISTESSLPTPRLVQLLSSFKRKFASYLESSDSLSTDKVLCITCGDLESQEHILNYQLPVVIKKYDVGLIVLDSVAANFRAEYERYSKRQPIDTMGRAAVLAKRGKELVQLGQTLRNLAREHNLAIVVANQVSDSFSSQARISNEVDVMSLDYQSQWFTGWGGDETSDDFASKKTPALGLVWANCIAARIALLKDYRTARCNPEGFTGRRIKVVFASWVEGGKQCDYVIAAEGIRGLAKT